MTKVPSRSKKMKAKHFLKCSGVGCGTVMFWNARAKRYELPHAQRQALNPQMFVDHPCPVCGALLERYGYTKDGQDKVMLRCSILDNRRGKCKEVAYFQSRGEFWSPKFGTLKLPEPQTES
jgi:DNA topoisomerase-1